MCLSINHTIAALIAVHGAWDEWSPWSLCSSTCGRGYRSRTRTCTPPQFGGDPCEGPEKQTKFCNIAVCPGEKYTNTRTKTHTTNLMSLPKCFHRTMQKAIAHCICSKSNFERHQHASQYLLVCQTGSFLTVVLGFFPKPTI